MLRSRPAPRTRLIALALLGLVSLSGCGWKNFTIVIPDFDSSRVSGVNIWRLDPSANDFVRVGAIEFLGTDVSSGVERLSYRMVNYGVPEEITPFTTVWRAQADPDTVTIRFDYLSRTLPGTFKVSTYNDAGDSPLTDESMVW